MRQRDLPYLNDSPYVTFTRQAWQHVHESDISRLEIDTDIETEELQQVYAPLAQLLHLYITEKASLHRMTHQLLKIPTQRVPYIIGVAGSVAVGKSMTSRALKYLLSQWPSHPNVEVLTTDGFLYPTAMLEERGLMQLKGFPESYNLSHLLQVLRDLKSGKSKISVPVYSHQRYDIVPEQHQVLDRPDIVILEGLNILQTGAQKNNDSVKAFVSDFLDFSIFIDAEMHTIKRWYIDRVLKFWETTFRDPESYFHYLVSKPKNDVISFASEIWEEINAINLVNNILPFKNRAQLILTKAEDHAVKTILLRKL